MALNRIHTSLVWARPPVFSSRSPLALALLPSPSICTSMTMSMTTQVSCNGCSSSAYVLSPQKALNTKRSVSSLYQGTLAPRSKQSQSVCQRKRLASFADVQDGNGYCWSSTVNQKGMLLQGKTSPSVNLWNDKMYRTMEDMTPEEKAQRFNRPQAQTTIDEEEIKFFSNLSAQWWDEGGEFEALHALNELRVPLIRDALVAQKRLDQYSLSKPLDGFWILDVGSGGGVLSEPLARLGANVVGVEASEDTIKIAQAHLIHDHEIRDRVKYIHTTVEDIAETQAGKFDAVVASEVLEHVADANTFVSACCRLVRPSGSVFFSTINKTYLSYALGVVMAEKVFRLLSPGTHDWNKFIPPRDLEYMLEKNNFSTRLIHGMLYNPLSKRWTWIKDTSISYALHAIRSPATEGEEDNVWTQNTSDSKE